MKKQCVLLCVVIGGVFVTGCSTSVDQAHLDYQTKLNMAYSQLQNGRPQATEQYLNDARKIAEENGYQQGAIHQLQAELCWTDNDLECIQEQVSVMKDIDPSDPRALELEGRIFIRNGNYVQAEEYFTQAQKSYPEVLDQQRMVDLISLVRGLQNYQQGNPHVAHRYFQDIQGVELQYAIDKALKELD